jgi:PBP1b-binding outer membrane lipoprotein LpoB
MSKFSLGSSLLIATLLLAGCAAETEETTPVATPTPVIAPELIPTAPPEEVVDVIPEGFLTSYGDVILESAMVQPGAP